MNSIGNILCSQNFPHWLFPLFGILPEFLAKWYGITIRFQQHRGQWLPFANCIWQSLPTGNRADVNIIVPLFCCLQVDATG